MITECLYFVDAYLTRFSARVVARAERGGRPAVALDQSAFYPEGGGQPHDAGALNDVPVRDVQVEDGVVWHMLEHPLEGDAVEGAIDWPRRFDHMQQHHGQHLLSAAFERLYGLRTISFHLGGASSTIDLAGAALTADQATAAEELANQVIWEDRPVLARFVTAEELAALPLRKPPAVEGAIRVVSVPDFDHSACGGTHPRATGGVGLLHIRRWERRASSSSGQGGSAVRVEFLCGGRALRDLRWKNAAFGRLAAALSVGAEQVEAATARLREAEERARKRLETVGEQLIAYEAHELIEHAERTGELRVQRRSPRAAVWRYWACAPRRPSWSSPAPKGWMWTAVRCCAQRWRGSAGAAVASRLWLKAACRMPCASRKRLRQRSRGCKILVTIP